MGAIILTHINRPVGEASVQTRGKFPHFPIHPKPPGLIIRKAISQAALLPSREKPYQR